MSADRAPPSAAPPSSGRKGAASFSVAGVESVDIATAIETARQSVRDPAGAIVFASGALAETAEATVSLVRAALGPVPAIFGTGAGVLTDRGEHERTSALAGIVWTGGSACTVAMPRSVGLNNAVPALAERIDAVLDGRAGTVVLCAEPGEVGPRTFAELGDRLSKVSVIGAGTMPHGSWAIPAASKAETAPVVGLVLRDAAKPVVRASPACKLLGPLEPITECHGAMVLRVGGQSALDVLSKSARGVVGQPLVFAVLAEGEEDHRPGRGNVVVRGIRGVDPTRGGVVITDEVRRGTRLCFGIRDAGSSRSDLESAAREIARDTAGAAPRFGLLVSCAGRGIGLYGASNVDTAIVREKFPQVPLAGMFSSFEIGPSSRRTNMHLYTAVLALFASPS